MIINTDVLIGSYATIAFLWPLYPIMCIANDTMNNGHGYFYLIPQLLLPEDQRPHENNIQWPGIPNNLLNNLHNSYNHNSHFEHGDSNNDQNTCSGHIQIEPEPELEQHPEPEPEPEQHSEPEPEPEPEPLIH